MLLKCTICSLHYIIRECPNNTHINVFTVLTTLTKSMFKQAPVQERQLCTCFYNYVSKKYISTFNKFIN